MRKKKIILFVILTLSTQFLFAIPKISYIIPDIGTPGLATYVEIIAPTDAFGNFGSDGLYFPENSLIKIIFDRVEDSSKVVVGPIYVSWQGRMISTYFFVKPSIPFPNSEDWRNLDAQYRIPFRVFVNGEVSNADTFYIVKPYSFGNLVQSNQIFGAGPLGIRSRSGAIIVDSLTLSALDYKAYLNNTISFPNPNRSYLPFILICKGNIIGQGSSTKINVSAGDGAIQNAGPGGGGGGGRFCDYLAGNPGEDAGRGLVSGGRGGTNNLFGGGNYKSLATGTGDSGKSINGVRPPEIPYGFEASGGATGHPFGISGIGSGDQSNWNYPGGYGGGTGSVNNRMGGSAGYSTDGANEPSNYNNGGKVHGNPMIMPLAGGSGGASGNPSGLNVCSGSGGGGGGAISIYAKKIENLSILADGKNGGSSSNGAGGGGSGGAIIVSAKLAVSNLSLSAKGGNGGGYGWIRVDAPLQASISYSHLQPAPFHSITSDTTTFVKKKFKITGSKSLESDSVILFLKPESADWSTFVLSGLRGSSTWQKDFTLTTKDTLLFFCAVDDLGFAITDTFKYKVQFVFSQSATNILVAEKFPEILCTNHLDLNGKECTGYVVIDSFPVINNGNADLLLSFSAGYFKQNKGFEIIKPKNDISLRPADTIWVVFKFIYSRNFGNPVVDTLVFGHNDANASKNPWEIEFSISLDRFLFENIELRNFSSIDTIDFGKLCRNEKRDTTFGIKNLSLFPIEFVLNSVPAPLSVQFSRIIINSNSLDSIKLSLSSISGNGQKVDSIEIFPVDCPEFKKFLWVKYFLAYPSTEFIFNKKQVDTIDFGKVCIDQTLQKSFLLRNIGNVPLQIAYQVLGDVNEFQVQSFSDNFVGLAENDSFLVSFSPHLEGKFSFFIVYSFDVCDFLDTLVCIGEGVQSNSVLVSTSGFGFVSVGDKDTIIVKVVNRGTGVSYFEQIPQVSGVFRFIGSQPDFPTYLRPNDTLYLFFEFEPQSDIYYTQQVDIIGNSVIGCPDTIRFVLEGNGTKAKIFANVDSVYFGILPYCKSKDTVIYISNKGTSTLRIDRVYITETNIPSHFSISNMPSSTIPPGGIDSCSVKFQGWKNATSGLKTAELVIENNDLQNPKIRIKLSAIQENVNVSITPDTIDFGIVQVGDSRQRNLQLVNKGTLQQRISNIYSNTGDFTAIPNVLVLEPTNQYNVALNFSPSRIGAIFDTLKVIYYSPCPDTQFIYVRGVGVGGDFAFPDTFNFGTVSICSNDTVVIPIRNLGTIPFTIDSATISGPDAVYYEILSIFPMTVDSIVYIKIVSYGSNIEREYNATLDLFVFINKSTQKAEIVLRTFRKRFINFDPTMVDIGMVQLFASFDTLSVIKNNSSNFGFITDYYGFDSRSPFGVINLSRGVAIPPTSEINFTIRFSPMFLGNISDTLFVLVQYPDCIDTIALVVQGFGTTPYEYKLRFDEVIMEPKEPVSRYPVFLKITSPMPDSLKFPIIVSTIVGTFNYNWHLFHITGISKGLINDDRINSTQRFITFKVDSIIVKDTNEFILTEFVGIPLLGDMDSTVVEWDSAYSIYFKPIGWSQIPDSVLTPGLIRTNICREGGPRLIKPSGSFSSLFIDEFDSKSKAILKIFTSGNVKMNIVNILGQVIFSSYFENNSENEKEFVILIPDFLPKGLYFVTFFNSDKYETIKIIKR